jgi:predicted metal-dependent HD superfamily phosphohydrolase
MSGLKFRDALQYAYVQLGTHLIPELHYHSYPHTRFEVVPFAQRIAKLEGIEGHERQLLTCAAAYHDIGWIKVRTTGPEYQQQRSQHEELSCQIAGEALPMFGFSPADIEVVQCIILATKLPTRPTNILEKVMCDADLASLGISTRVYWKRSTALRKELEEFSTFYSDLDWFNFQIQFLTSQSYYTESAHRLFDINKLKNLVTLQKKIHKLHLRGAL